MKRLIYLFLIMLMFMMSCNGNQVEKEKKRADSIAKAEAYKEGLKKIARMDSLADFAWGEMKFGITKKELLQTKIGKDGVVGKDYIFMENNNLRALKKVFRLKRLQDFVFIFENNELTEIRMESTHVDANHIKELVSECDIFVNNFKKKMGEPYSPMKGEKPTILDFTVGKLFTYANFSMGLQKSMKEVWIWLGESDDGCEYYYRISISNSCYPKRKKVKSSKEIENEKKEEVERQSTINNSF